MKLIMNSNTSAYFNLACEEYMAGKSHEDMFMVWTCEPTAMIGRNQNTYAEIDVAYVEERGIAVVRRASGGGTIFSDKGTMHFTFITSDDGGFTDFKRFAEPVMAYLKSLGVPVAFTGRNDLTIEGKKFSGNAQYKINGKVVHHGSLLFDASLSELSRALTPNKVKFKDKSVKSVASRVTNIKDHLADAGMSVEAFRQGLYDYMKANVPKAEFYELSSEEVAGVEDLVTNKYGTWEWNYGKTPKFQQVNREKFSGGLVEISLTIKKGCIEDIAIHGDFFGNGQLKTLEEQLVGVQYNRTDLITKLETLDLTIYMAGITKDEFVDLMLR